MAQIHPTALVDPSAALADDVEIGPYCIVESDVRIGAGTVLRPHVVIRRYSGLGEGNFVDSFAVIGGAPQDHKFSPDTVSYVEIGDQCTFREGVTINRPTTPEATTRVGNGVFMMTQSHIAHDCTVGDHVIFANNASLAGHVTVEARAFLSASVSVHQFVWVGEMVMFRGLSGASAHIPPFAMVTNINEVCGINTVGMRRAPEITPTDRAQVQDVYQMLFRSGQPTTNVLAELDRRDDLGPAATKVREFVRRVLAAEAPFKRPLPRMRG